MAESDQNDKDRGSATEAGGPAKTETQTGSQTEARPDTKNEAKADGAPAGQGDVARLTEEKRELNDRMLRIAADFENFKRRARKEMEEAGARSVESLLKEVLPVLDNMDRAVAAAAPAKEGEGLTSALLDGVRLVQKQFLGVLEKFNVKPFDAEGKPFDPAFHEAVQQMHSDTLPPGSIAKAFQRGYMIGARLLRPAMVAVVSGRASSSSSASASAPVTIDAEPVEPGQPVNDAEAGEYGGNGSGNGQRGPLHNETVRS